MINMKKLYYLLITAVSFALAACNGVTEVEPDDIEQEEPVEYSIIARCAETKTTLRNLSTYWSENDDLNVFCRVNNGYYTREYSGRFIYGSDDKFSGTFSGSVNRTGDWYCLYPYSSSNTSSSKVTVSVGSSLVQTGNDSQSHLAGGGFPLFGVITSVPVGVVPKITMNYILSFVNLAVTNTADDPLKVTEIEFTTPSAVSGSFSANLTSSTVTWSPVQGKTSNSVKVTVKDGEPVAKGASASFYFGMMPVSANGQYTLKISGECGGKPVSVERKFTADLTFSAGMMKKLKYSFVYTAPEEDTSKYYVKVTSAPADGDWTGKYLVVNSAGTKAFNALSESSTSFATDVTVQDGKILSTADIDKYALTVTNAGIEHVNVPGYYAHDVRNSDGKYIYYSSSAIRVDNDNVKATSGTDYNYYHTFKYDSNGVQMMSGVQYGGWSQYYITYSSSNFTYVKDATSNRVQLYRLESSESQEDPDTPDTPDTPDDPDEDIPVFNLESTTFSRYFDAAEEKYTDTNWGSGGVTVARNFTTGKGGDGYDFPKPVTVSWTGSTGSSKVVVVYKDKEKKDEETRVTVSSSSSSANIYNLIPNRTYYYTVTSGNTQIKTGAFKTEGRRRQLRITGTVGKQYANNARDFGGIMTSYGKPLKYNVAFRGSNMSLLSDEGKNYMVDYLGIRADIDLRRTDGSNDNKAMPALPQDKLLWSNAGYDSLAELQDKNKTYKTFTDIIETVTSGGAVYIHCMVGADRTGYICFLLQAVCGVSPKDCSIDYELTSFSCVGLRPRDGGREDYGGYFKDGMAYIRDYVRGGSFRDNAAQILMDAGIKDTQIEALRKAMIEGY